jgi:hypothetical protein
MRLPDSSPLLSLEYAHTTWRFWRFDGHFWARCDAHERDFVACVLDHDGSLWRSWNGDKPREARERLRATIQNDGFFRAFELESGERILLHRSQAFALNQSGELARFEMRGARFRQTRYLLSTPTGELSQALNRERKRAACDLRAAFAWLDAPPDERAFFGLQWTTGDGATLRRLVLAGFWCCDELWQERSELEYRLAATPGSEFGAETSFVDSQGLPRPRFRAAPFRLARLLQKVVACNRPFLPRGVRLNREVGVGPLAQRETNKTGTLRFVIGAPNAHEQLEARLDLRDWLRDEAPELLGEWF